MVEYTRMQRIRRGYRSVFTKLVEELANFLSGDPIDEVLVESTFTTLTSRYQQITSLDEKIIDVVNEDDIHGEIESTSEYLTAYNSMQIKVKSFVSKMEAKRSQATNSNIRQFDGNVRLPKLTLPFFDGDILKWTAFWETFSGAVHNNEYLSGANKFEYLYAQLQGDAASLIQGFQHTSDAYVEAVNLLKKTYGDKQKIIRGHLHHIFHIPRPTGNATELLSFRNTYESHIRSLKVLGIDVGAAGHVYTALLTRKLPLQIRDNINRATGKGYLELTEFRNAVDEEIERLAVWDQPEQSNEPTRSNPTYIGSQRTVGEPRHISEPTRDIDFGQRIVSNLHTSTTNNSRCQLCDGNHRAISCTTHDTPRKRKQVVKTRRLCFNCLSFGHRVDRCTSNATCMHCGRRHHSSICFSRLHSDCIDKHMPPHATSNDVVQPHSSGNNRYDGKHTSRSHNVIHSCTSTILPTAVVGIVTPVGVFQARTLFDQGSQRSFILNRTMEQLNLPVSGTTRMSINGFNTKGQSKLYNVVRVNTITKDGNVEINAIAVEKLPGDIQMHGRHRVVHDIQSRNVVLADPHLDDTVASLQLSIGADHYHDYVYCDKLHDIAIIPSKLGCLLSGRTPINAMDNSVNNSGASFVTALHVNGIEDVNHSISQSTSLLNETAEDGGFVDSYVQDSEISSSSKNNAVYPDIRHSHGECTKTCRYVSKTLLRKERQRRRYGANTSPLTEVVAEEALEEVTEVVSDTDHTRSPDDFKHTLVVLCMLCFLRHTILTTCSDDIFAKIWENCFTDESKVNEVLCAYNLLNLLGREKLCGYCDISCIVAISINAHKMRYSVVQQTSMHGEYTV